jgi:3-oxoacyl-[acyl-carrier-protein] synthase-3
VKFGAIGPIAVHLPARVETNEDLQREFPQWDMPTIAEKTGVYRRHIAAADECSSDLAVAAAQRLFREQNVDPSSIDYLLFCTQTPDYPLPTTACLIQDRLGLRNDIGAIDFNLGCSGFVYGLSLADGLIRTGAVERCLLLTAETYSKFIHPTDRSLRTIFGDAAAATLIEATGQPSIQAYEFGTDGRGADTLLVTAGGHRKEPHAHRPRGRKRWPSDLYMDGPSLMSFTVDAIPGVIDRILSKAGWRKDQVSLFLMHQATEKLLRQLQLVLELDDDRMPIDLRDVGNTVSSTLPILIDQLRRERRLTPSMQTLMMGFGVGWSWAGCVWQDILGTSRMW